MRSDEVIWKRTMNKYFDKQLRELLALIEESEVFGLTATVQGFWNDDALYKIYNDLYGRLGQKYYLQSEASVQKSSFDPFTIKADGDFDPLDEWWINVERFVSTEVAYRVVSVNKTTRDLAIKAIKGAIDEGLEEGLGMREISKKIDAAVKLEWRHMKTFRPLQIARTEVLSASNYASYQGALGTGLEVQKVWLHSFLMNERPWHLSYSGTAVDINEPFILDGDRMRFPGDPRASARNTINCRCVQIYES